MRLMRWYEAQRVAGHCSLIADASAKRATTALHTAVASSERPFAVEILMKTNLVREQTRAGWAHALISISRHSTNAVVSIGFLKKATAPLARATSSSPGSVRAVIRITGTWARRSAISFVR